MTNRIGKFQGCIGAVAEYDVYASGDEVLLYKGKENAPCYRTTDYRDAERFAGCVGYDMTSRGPVPRYAPLSWEAQR